MLTPAVMLANIVQPPIDLRFSGLALDQGMAKFVQDHLRKAVVRIEYLIRADQHSAATVSRGVHFGATLDTKAYMLGASNPDSIERILIQMLRAT